ncbi:MAG: anaerobic ribonucleoside-triphosphate reductase activating protein [Bacillota bacterium]|jgi:pyruvate formate lyase activating enzyme|nr:anaerobic ribonucleoside-triphosphate reductase activating protein [Bacillota bacterium]
MKILGLEKLSLLDYPGKLCCTIFTGGCNMRCPFCHNAPLVLRNSYDQHQIEWGEIIQFLRARVKLLDGVCISGGEPTLHKELRSRIEEIKRLGFLVKLDTNGTNPSLLKELVDAGLVDYIALDVKNSPEKYALTAGVEHFDLSPVRESAAFLLSGAVDYEFRTTVVKEFHTENDLLTIAQWLKGAKRYYLQQFVDSGSIIRPGLHAYSEAEMQHFKAMIQPVIPYVELRGIG